MEKIMNRIMHNNYVLFIYENAQSDKPAIEICDQDDNLLVIVPYGDDFERRVKECKDVAVKSIIKKKQEESEFD
jgi:hypothetical protein